MKIMMMMTRGPEAIRHSCDIFLYRFLTCYGYAVVAIEWPQLENNQMIEFIAMVHAFDAIEPNWNNNMNRRHSRSQTNIEGFIWCLLQRMFFFVVVLGANMWWVAVNQVSAGCCLDWQWLPQLYDGTNFRFIFFFFFIQLDRFIFSVSCVGVYYYLLSRHPTTIDFFPFSRILFSVGACVSAVIAHKRQRKNVISTKKWKHKHWENICR